MKVIAVIAAAGSGTRMNISVPKTLLEIDGRTVLERSAETILGDPRVSEAVVAAPANHTAVFKDKLSAFGGRIAVIPGGSARQESVYRALQHIRDNHDTAGLLVLIHDAARCMVSADIVSRSIDEAARHGAVTVAVPLSDSIKLAGPDGEVVKSLSRENVWAIQTPQVFRFELIYEAHGQAARSGRNDFTDDAGMLEGTHDVFLVPGDRLNFKITTPEDYEIARRLVFLQKSFFTCE